MDKEGSSKHPEAEKGEKSVPRPPDDGAMRKRPKREDVIQGEPTTAEEEEKRADLAGSRNYPHHLWTRLKNPPSGRSTIDLWEFKMDGEVMTMTFTCDGEKHPMYFTPRSAIDYQMRPNHWIARHNNMYRSLRTRLFSLPKSVSINRLLFYNTPECEAEDCLIEFMFIKKWTCKHLEYNITTEFNHPQHLRKLVHMFKPTDVTVFLSFGPYQYSTSAHEPNGMHNHLAALDDGLLMLEKDFRVDCTHALNSAGKGSKELTHLYGEAGRGKAFGLQMIRTLVSLRKFVQMMVEKQMAQTKGISIRKFIVNGPTNDKMCPKLLQLFKDDVSEDANTKRLAYAAGERVYVCVRNDLRRAFKYSLAMPTVAFKMTIGNEQLLSFTKSVATFHCLFRTNVDENGIVQLIAEWQRGDRNIDEIQLHLDKVIEPEFASQFNADFTDPKRIKIRRIIHDRRSTMYIERERLSTRHLSLRVLDVK